MSNVRFNISKLLFTLVVVIYFFWYTNTTDTWIFLDNINLVFHEAGHALAIFLPKIFYVAAGSLFQILFPCIFVLYFYKLKNYYSASLLLFWVGQNFISVSKYVGDAITMQLPLLGSDGSLHDWNYILKSFHLLTYSGTLSQAMFFIGVVIICAASIISLYYSRVYPKNPRNTLTLVKK